MWVFQLGVVCRCVLVGVLGMWEEALACFVDISVV